ncbi:MAG: sigma 54-interacting transcriptional regulator [Selenomonadaceae bacterium]
MQASLLWIQDTVLRYAQIIAKISQVDVEVVDDRLYRIAGTGIYADKINTDMSEEGYVYRHVLQTGERQIIAAPGMDELCLHCPKRSCCKEVFEISAPIKLDKKIVGVIGMVSSNALQKELLEANLASYLDFIDATAFFITAKLREYEDLRTQMYALTMTADAMAFNQLLGSSEGTIELRQNIKKIAGSTSTVLITGESGTGKEMVASSIWRSSDRADKRFVTINCAAIPEQLLESELFGYVKGAFTGANPNGRMGKFELANQGVLFLDEIGDMPLYLQAKLLRVLQERQITRVGSNQVIPVDIRILAATNKNLQELIGERKFREDLYYRLNVIPLKVLPLRQRKDDIKELTEHFLERYTGLFHKTFKSIEPEIMQKLMDYKWPGNVRELENTVEFMVNMMGDEGIIGREALPKTILKYRPERVFLTNTVVPLRELEHNAILKALRLYGMDTNGKRKAAKSLGIGVATLYRKLDGLSK